MPLEHPDQNVPGRYSVTPCQYLKDLTVAQRQLVRSLADQRVILAANNDYPGTVLVQYPLTGVLNTYSLADSIKDLLTDDITGQLSYVLDFLDHY